uniref:Uncharacterized protein n=1 Tax=Solanum tuberosum TaxID=4113 RepID=M1DKL8_SOLTU
MNRKDKILKIRDMCLAFEGENVRVRLLGTTLRVPEEDHNPWPNKLPRQLEVVHGGSGSASRTCSANGQRVAPRRGDTADCTVSKFYLQKLHGTPPIANLVPDEICENKTQV